MDEPPELQYDAHWRLAVWSLRVGYFGLSVALAGLIVKPLGFTELSCSCRSVHSACRATAGHTP
jgi:hypothetical protein